MAYFYGFLAGVGAMLGGCVVWTYFRFLRPLARARGR